MGIALAWMVGESIIIWRWTKAKAPPPPGVLLLASGLYLGLAIMAEYQPARTVATTFAWAVDLAILLQVVGKDPHEVTGWPPPFITDPSVIFPSKASQAAGSGSSTSVKTNNTGTRGAPGTTVT